MAKYIPYDELEKHFTSPKVISSFFNYKRVPRKLKKKHIEILSGSRYSFLDENQKLWYILGLVNPNYKRFLIKQITK
jgi:hypothetical protein